MTWLDEVEAWTRNVDRLLARRGLAGDHGLLRTWNDAEPGELVEQDEAWRMAFDLPGFQRNDVHLTVKDGVLTLEAHRDPGSPEGFRAVHRERRGLQLQRSWRLPVLADASAIRADFADGVLTLTVPKRADARPRSIEIHSA